MPAQSGAGSGPLPPSSRSWQTASRCSSWVREGKGNEKWHQTPCQKQHFQGPPAWVQPRSIFLKTHAHLYMYVPLLISLSLTFDKAYTLPGLAPTPICALSRPEIPLQECQHLEPQGQVKGSVKQLIIKLFTLHMPFLVSQCRAGQGTRGGGLGHPSGPNHLGHTGVQILRVRTRQSWVRKSVWHREYSAGAEPE